jgi:hypothetical protein
LWPFTFDGSGDEGVGEDIKCYATEDYAYEEREVHEVNFAEGFQTCGFSKFTPHGRDLNVRLVFCGLTPSHSNHIIYLTTDPVGVDHRA